MPPKKRPWFRLYTETMTDPKIRRLTPAQRWLWVAVLAAARQSPVQGALMLTEHEAMTMRDLANLADLSLKVTRTGVARLEELGLVGRDQGAWRALAGRVEGDEVWIVNRWSDRQFETDDVSVRTAEWRKRHSDGTSMERSNGVPGNAPESETENRPSSSPPVTSPAQRPEKVNPEDDRDGFVEQTLTATWEFMASQTLDRVKAEGQAIRNPTAWARTAAANFAEQYRDRAIDLIGSRSSGTYYDLHVEIAEALDDRCGPPDGGAARAEARRQATLAYLHPDQGAA